jgi:uncharacterized protein
MAGQQPRVSLTPHQEQWRQKYGPWAIVTGASDGIGREIALCLAQRGLNLLLVARRRSLLEELVADLSVRFGIETAITVADLSHESGVNAVIEAGRGLDIGLLVASAGYGTTGNFIELPLERELSMVDVNSRAVIALSHHFGQRFAEKRQGGIMLISSLVAFQGVPRSATYAATKAFVQSFAEGLQVELAPLGVDVLSVAPGPVHSGFAAHANMQMGAALKAEEVARESVEALGKQGTVRPGWLSKVLEGSLALLPRWGRVRVMQQVMKGMTNHQSTIQAVPSREAK